MKKKKIALVLSGGGFNCAFQLGALNSIQKHWKQLTGLTTPMKFDIVAGVSGGALNGVLVAMNQLPLLNDLWIHRIGRKGVSEIYTSEIIDTTSQGNTIKLKLDIKQLLKKLTPQINVKLDFFRKLGVAFSKRKRKQLLESILKEVEQNIKINLPKYKSIADNSSLRKKLEKYLDRNQIKGTKFLCGFVSLDTGNYHGVIHDQFQSEQDFVNGVLASTSIPTVWNPVEKISFYNQYRITTSYNNVDGGIRNVSPLGDVIQLINEDQEDCEYKIIIINTRSGILKHKDFSNQSLVGIAVRSLYEIAMSEIFHNDIKHFLDLNKVVKQTKSWGNDNVLRTESNKIIKAYDAIVIQPDANMNLGNSLVANKELIERRIKFGEEMTKKYI